MPDPRLSLEERYVDHAGYVRAVKAAADALVRDGYLLAKDATGAKARRKYKHDGTMKY